MKAVYFQNGAASLVASLVVGAASAGSPPAGPGTATNWYTPGGDSNETHYSRLADINAATLGRLHLAWSLDVPNEAALAGSPLAIDGMLYFTGDHAVIYAVDAASGKQLWTFDPKVWEYHPAAVGWHYGYNHGAAYADGRLFVAAMDGRLFAVDAHTGHELWHADTLGWDDARYMHGAPRVFNGKVIIGNGSADVGKRGYVSAYDAATGHLVWRFYTAPGSPDENRGDPAMERAAATWGPGEFWKTGTGGGAWDSIVFDQELDQIYLGTANPVGTPPDVRSPGGGDNLYTSSIVALNADTGKYVWHYQINPRDGWDYDATEQITLAELTVGGQRHKVLMQAPKNGFFYVIDRRSGKLLSAEKFGKATWADRIDLTTGRPVEAPHVREPDADIWPSANGAHSWQAMSYSPKSGLVYIPTMQMGVHFDRPGGMGSRIVKADDRDGKGALVAWDQLHQRQAWFAPHDTFFNGGTLATAGNLVVQGTADGYLLVYDATTGKELWRFYAGLGIISAPISYAVADRQYIAVLTGYGASAGAASMTRVGWRFTTPRRLLTFALDAHGTPPPTEQPDMGVHAVDDSALTIDPAAATRGRELYDEHCRICHGGDVASTGAAPDLRESRVALSQDALWTVAHDGALIRLDMPRFDDLNRDDIAALFAYIRQTARAAIVATPAAK